MCAYLRITPNDVKKTKTKTKTRTSAIAADELHVVLAFSHFDWRGPLLRLFLTEELVAFLAPEYTHAT